MPKISAYPEFADEASYLIIQDGANNYKCRLDNLLRTAAAYVDMVGAYVEDFIAFTGNLNFIWTNAIGAGAVQILSGSDDNHLGILTIFENGANTGAAVRIGNMSGVLIAGGEEAEFIFRTRASPAYEVHMGFHDALDTAAGAPVDGVWLRLQNNTAIFFVRVASANNYVSASYTVANNTWYRAKIIIDATATHVTFILYDGSGNLLEIFDSIAVTLPTAAGQETGFGINGAGTTAVGLVPVVDVDFVSLYMPKVLTR